MTQKKCTVCKENKNICDFNKNKSKKDGLNTICRSCSNIRSKQYYSDNSKNHKKLVLDRNKKINLGNRIKLYDYYKTHPCVDCGEKDPIVLEFDHKDSKTKTNNISVMVNNSFSWNKILEEINKCDVRCANCHRRKTAKQFNWYFGIPL